MNTIQHYHLLSERQVIDRLESDKHKGLTLEEADKRLWIYGENKLTPPKGEPPWKIFLKQFQQPLIYILIVAGIGVGFLGEWIEMGVILGVVLINAIIGYFQEVKALKAIQALSKNLKEHCLVLRDGNKQSIDTHQLVPGDIIFLKAGDRVPADVRILEAKELKIDESALTGESLPTTKNCGTFLKEKGIGDQSNMAFSTTLVTFGTATALVVATADQTEIGKINKLIAHADILVTPLTEKIEYFSKILLWIILGLASIAILSGLYRGHSIVNVLMEGVALAVGAIPEGLPTVVTITLAIGVSRMAKRKAIIRKLPAVETLGSTTVICSDKTGTLTQNEMTVQKIMAAHTVYSLSGVGYSPFGEISLDDKKVDVHCSKALFETLLAGVLCNASNLIQEKGTWKIEGDPTEGALITSGIKCGIPLHQVRKGYSLIDEIPFESEYQYMASLYQNGNSQVIYIKGSPEKLLPRCKNILDQNGKTSSIEYDKIQKKLVSFAKDGLRVLAFCKKEILKKRGIDHEDVDTNLTFLGFQAMIDPPRPEAISAVEVCHQAGIEVKMITGDHQITATSIAHQLGIINNNDASFSIRGEELKDLNQKELSEIIDDKQVFARVNPHQKLILIKALQEKNNIVAMTGDGVNDAPALRQANIGIAMGLNGTEVAKETSDMILTDDNFSTIKDAIEEGRNVFDNLIKFIIWTIPTNVTEGLVILVASLLGLMLPITPLQILWINMSTAIFLGATLAFEKQEISCMNRPPQPPNTPILTHQMLFRITWVSLYLVASIYFLFDMLMDQGIQEEKARTICVNLIVFGELFYLFNTRSLRHSVFKIGFFSNPWLIGGVITMILLQLIFTYSPAINSIFGSTPITPYDWAWIIGLSAVLYLLVELEKGIRRL
ncbi:cation-transporting P-type ATPase [Flammeovirga sp. SubArs3]|uniref:cation-translocating P-type ATPase n=1 Tax=Flammeovirga sp. SubArs3 TaxID=2995316 RepID=UPI00248C7A8B|nr:cation-transporting P-type ATPase [Flammeovirga sp. SubArs3]